MRRWQACVIKEWWRGRRMEIVWFASISSGYKSASSIRGMCSVRAKVFIPRAIAVCITSSRLSFA